MYAAIEHEVRGCPISKCTRYKGGEKIKARLSKNLDMFWEYDYERRSDEPGTDIQW